MTTFSKRFFTIFSVKQEVKTLDDEAIRVKEQAILEIGTLFAETKQATGETEKERIVCMVM